MSSRLAEDLKPEGNIQYKSDLQLILAKKLTPIKVIRRTCLKCMYGSYSAVRECQDTDCPCFPYRMGKNPKRKGIGGGIDRANKNSCLNSTVLLQDRSKVSS